MVYISLCQSVLNYCIVVWGVAHKTHLLKLERAQRAILKIAYSKPRRYPTDDLYSECRFLRVRQLYISATIVLFHRQAKFHARTSYRSLKWDCPKIRTSFARRSSHYMGPYLYTKIYKINNNILNMIRSRCRFTVHEWLLSRSYDKTETLFETDK